MTPPFALFEIAPERVNAFFMYVLSILGGGVAGFVAAVYVGKLIDRVVLGKGKYSAEVLHKIFRILCGLGAAILIAILMFPGGGGGTGTGEGSQDGTGKTGSPSDGTGGPDPKVAPTPQPTPLPGHVLDADEKARAVIRLEILGGSDLKAGTDFYREIGKEAQLTLDGVEKLVAERKATLKPGVGVAIEYRLTRYSKDDPNFQGLTTLRNWGVEKKVSVDPADKNGN